MNEKKIKFAFQKVKEDMNFLKGEIEKLNQTPQVKITKELEKVEKIENKIENEIKALNVSIKEINNNVSVNSKNIEKIKEEIKKNKEETKKIEKEVNDKLRNLKKSFGVNKVVEINSAIEKQLNDFSEIINEKIELQNANLRLELETEIANLAQEFSRVRDTKEGNSNLDEKLAEIVEMINEKISLETSSLKLEYTEEISKLYDKFFNEIMDFKKELESAKKGKTITKKEPQKKVEKQTNTKKTSEKPKKNKTKEASKEEKENELYESPFENEKKEGKLKKIAKWLFVDEEDEEKEISDIKKEIKNKK